jgi:hypothetical protein
MEEQVQQEATEVGPGAPAALTPLQQEVVVYGIVALILTCLAVFINNSPMVRDAGFFAKLFAIIVGTGLGTVCAMIGNALRKAVHPDAIWTSGGFWSLLWARVFWKWGPQTIGMFIGLFVGIAMVLK